MRRTVFNKTMAALALAAAFLGGVVPTEAGDKSDREAGRVRTVTVTLEGGAAVDPKDFGVYRGETRLEVVDVKGPEEAPINLAVLIQDGVDMGVGHELATIG